VRGKALGAGSLPISKRSDQRKKREEGNIVEAQKKRGITAQKKKR